MTNKRRVLPGLLTVVGVPEESDHSLDEPEDGVIGGLWSPRVFLKNQEAENTKIAIEYKHLKHFACLIQLST